MTREELASKIDHTFLKAAGEPDAVHRLCREAREFRFACAMVNPCEVPLAASLLEGSGVRVGTVVGFPLGANTCAVKVFEAETAVRDGAREIDFVVNVRRLKESVADASVRAALLGELKACNACVKALAKDAVTKLILECCYLTDEEKVLGCVLAKEAGFDFVKTSTGFGSGGATVHDVELMRSTVGGSMGVKAAGGIRTLSDAMEMLKAGANRLGCSAGVDILRNIANATI